MDEPVLGQIFLCAFTFLQTNYLFCDGSAHAIVAFQQLGACLQNVYGGIPGLSFGVPKLALPAGWTAANASWQIAVSGYPPSYDGLGYNEYLGELDVMPITPGNEGWVSPGTILQINAQQFLFDLYNTRFGGDGTNTFGTPSPPPPSVSNAEVSGLLQYYVSVTGEFPGNGDAAGVSQVLGTIALFPYSFVPTGWAPCNGTLQSIRTSNEALYAVIGQTFGGTGLSFALPTMQAPPNLQWCICVAGAYPSNAAET